MMDNCYSWGDFPFQLCSIPMYMCLIAPWLKPGKLQRGMYSFMVLYNLLGGAISFTEPSGLLHGHWFLTLHACIWHMLLVFVGLFICFSKRGGNQKADYWGATWTFIALCGIAFGLNCFVQFGLGESMNMFFVGPGNSPIIVFKQVSEWFGWYINTPIYIHICSVPGCLHSLCTDLLDPEQGAAIPQEAGSFKSLIKPKVRRINPTHFSYEWITSSSIFAFSTAICLSAT